MAVHNELLEPEKLYDLAGKAAGAGGGPECYALTLVTAAASPAPPFAA